MRAHRLLWFVALSLGGWLGREAAAEPLGHLGGVVEDGGHHGISGATVVLRGPTSRTLRTDGGGQFGADVLAGSYTVTVSAGGFASASSTVAVAAGASASVRMALSAISVDKAKAPEPKPPVHEAPAKVEAKPRGPMREPMYDVAPAVVAPSPAMPSPPRGRVSRAHGFDKNAGDRQDGEFNTEAYAHHADNPFFVSKQDPLSTFSIDVDTASYSNVRRFLHDGTQPPPDAVRVEELINYFPYADPAPTGGAPLAVRAEVGPAPWNDNHRLMRIGVRSPTIPDSQVPARNLVFLIDVSGSMDEPNKLPLLQRGLGLLVDQLRPQDRVAIAVYAGASGLALPSTMGTHKDEIRAVINRLEPGGSTNGAAGIQLAYQLAAANFQKGGINRVILCTDGDFNVGTTSEGDLTRMIERERERGVFLTVLGFGMGNVKDSTMEMLADKGNGNYAYIDSLEEARKVLVKESGSTLMTVAKDVKLQVEFNPAVVAGYRLIGYEDRMLAAQDFNDDKKDAGELGAGHTVTALYELVPAGQPVPSAKVDALKYQVATVMTGGAGELATIKVRYKAPDGNVSKLMSQPVTDGGLAIKATSQDFRWAAAVAGFGMILRGSKERGNVTWAMVSALAEGAVGTDVEGYRHEFLRLVELAKKLPDQRGAMMAK
jgi:Ca-activated chloride channel family protein